MSQNQNYDCGCTENTTSIPIRGINISIDTDLLKQCECNGSSGGRIRVTQDLHVYVDGNRTESGDGLTPETAVKSYEDAVNVLSRYDGCNAYKAVLHFADLADKNAEYPSISVYPGTYSTFIELYILGNSRDTTELSDIYVNSATTHIDNVSIGQIVSYRCSSVDIAGSKIRIKPKGSDKPVLAASTNSFLCADNADIQIQGGVYQCIFHAGQGIIRADKATFICKAGVQTTVGFAFLTYHGSLALNNTVFSGTATGSRYSASALSCINTGGKGTSFLPGSVAGTLSGGSVYL